MCITFFILNPKSQNGIELIVAFNRDQQVRRKTLKLAGFQDDPNIYAGRDLKSNGTWLGFNIKTGIFTFLTNYDLDPSIYRKGKSRGKMIKSFLATNFIQNLESKEDVPLKIKSKMNEILMNPKQYCAFNLVVYHLFTGKLFYLCTENGMKEVQSLSADISYGLCNTELNNIWPKTQHGLSIFSEIVKQLPEKLEPQIFAELQKLMKDKTKFSEDPENQAAIFIEPYFSAIQQAQRMTKSTFYGIFKSNKSKFTATFKETTYHVIDGQLKEQIVEKSLEMES